MTADLPEVGSTLLSKYRIERRLAVGGMGAVYEAVDVSSGTAVAVKMLHPELSDDDVVRRRFRREASILASIAHPAVVRVHDHGTDEFGRDFLVMEYLRGETLAGKILRAQRLSARDASAYAVGMAEGLEQAHSRGIVHGDVKPQNVFLVSSGGGDERVTLVDFGLAKIQGLDRLTRTGEMSGTPVYMAPELFTGNAARIDATVDVYAMAVVLYEALALRPPFDARHPGRLMLQIARGERAPLHATRPDLGVGVTAVLERALSVSPGDRFQAARDFADAFRRAAGAP